MNFNEMRLYLIKTLLTENNRYKDIQIPDNAAQQDELLRSLMNVRPPSPVGTEFLKIQDAYLQELAQQKGIVDVGKLQPVPLNDKICLWQGDITRLKADAIVNAANNQMLGCFVPCHGCIDNAIHTFAGVQLRYECNQFMEKQNQPEPTGKAKITSGYNLPCRYVIHTVGPIINSSLTENDCSLLADCYRSCFTLAEENKLTSIAFCCISTGEFRFPNQQAAEIALQTITSCLNDSQHIKKVIFNVYKDHDREIYERLLGVH